jgi:hypothetical protein
MATTVREKNYTPLEHPPQIPTLTVNVSSPALDDLMHDLVRQHRYRLEPVDNSLR